MSKFIPSRKKVFLILLIYLSSKEDKRQEKKLRKRTLLLPYRKKLIGPLLNNLFSIKIRLIRNKILV